MYPILAPTFACNFERCSVLCCADIKIGYQVSQGVNAFRGWTCNEDMETAVTTVEAALTAAEAASESATLTNVQTLTTATTTLRSIPPPPPSNLRKSQFFTSGWHANFNLITFIKANELTDLEIMSPYPPSNVYAAWFWKKAGRRGVRGGVHIPPNFLLQCDAPATSDTDYMFFLQSRPPPATLPPPPSPPHPHPPPQPQPPKP